MQPIGVDTPAEYLNAVLDLMEAQAYFAKKITNWDNIRQQARIMAGHARTIDETYPAIQMVLERMQHRHSYLIPAETFQRIHGQVNNATYGFSILRDQRQIGGTTPEQRRGEQRLATVSLQSPHPPEEDGDHTGTGQ